MNTDLTTRYLGLSLSGPLVVSACPLTAELDVLERLEQQGAAAAVMPSLFQEQLQAAPGGAESLAMRHSAGDGFFPELRQYNRGPDVYLKQLDAAKKAVSIPIIGSLNLTAPGPALEYARRIAEAGADALELNLNFRPKDFDTPGHEVEAQYVDIVRAVREQVSLPLAVKIGPYFTSLGNLAQQLVAAGANGLVLFNRSLQPHIDLTAISASSQWTFTKRGELGPALQWIAQLHGRMPVSLAATGGAHTAADVVKLLLVGADVVMVASALYLQGLEVLPKLIGGVREWLEANDFASLSTVRGCLSHCADAACRERAVYSKALATFMEETTSNPSAS